MAMSLSVCVWRHYFDEDKDKVQTKLDRGAETYTRVDGQEGDTGTHTRRQM